MKTRFWIFAALFSASALFAQDVSLFNPIRPAKDQGLTLKAWGSGTCVETDEAAFKGTRSIRIATRNFFQGGIMNFERPVDVSREYQDPALLFQISFTSPPKTGAFLFSNDLFADSSDFNTSFLGFGPAISVGQGRSRRGGGDAEGSAPANAAESSTSKITVPGLVLPSFDRMRVLIATTDNLRSEIYLEANTSFVLDHGWRQLAFPLSAVKGFDRTNKIIKSISISADQATSIYVGDMKFVKDVTPIQGDIADKGPINVGLGGEVDFKTYGYAGSTILRYEWCFDSDKGFEPDAEGGEVRHRFWRPGDYTVACRISDRYGLKKPLTVSVKVKVNP
ncbi:MAG: hypothetical protein JSS72_05035 [Armatimonadetes bacterium]|nr:hypothetical protein [Armatimonadota bacterium]